MRHAAFLGKSSSILVASSPFNLSSDYLFSPLTWSIAYFSCLIELFYHRANRFTANMQLLAMEELLYACLWRVTIVFLSIVISQVKQVILPLNFLNLLINILMNRFNPLVKFIALRELTLQRSIKPWLPQFWRTVQLLPHITLYIIKKASHAVLTLPLPYTLVFLHY